MIRYRVIMNFADTTPDLLFHIALADDWEACGRFGEYDVATKGVPFDALGRIHLSEWEQLPQVVAAKYAAIREPLLLIALSTAALASEGDEFELSPTPGLLRELAMDSPAIIAVLPFEGDGDLPSRPVVAMH